ncbi:hypothetical protein shim_14580 [Shimia sp. SK013]|uniref:hypothetical protein n=1 Tax=Shimia sp. SK013 TaxID=1389006 RepID=UPI0006B63933|nr:hypothetical protein [Shimia sp. SK013]KPA23163.1 hypothetical protein shim_14580 [Shimia sp. SK013]
MDSTLTKEDQLQIHSLSRRIFVITVGLTLSSSAALAAPGATKTCQKMISEDRADGQTQAQCECTYQLVEEIFDEDLKTLTFDSWYNGTNNMAALEALPNRNKVLRQMKKLYRQSQKKCG